MLSEDKLFQFVKNQLVRKIIEAYGLVKKYKHRARHYYFDVLFSIHRCPACGGHLKITGESNCSCSCGNVFDPTLAFQKSACCGAGLIRKTFHYACARCNKTIASRFLFDEKVFDKQYFREMMRESRQRKKKKREEIKRLLVNSRSSPLCHVEEPQLESIPGLIDDLNGFIRDASNEYKPFSIYANQQYEINRYRGHILSLLTWDSVLFSKIEPLIEDTREDRIYRFITLVFMDNEREIELRQLEDDLSVQRLYNEAYA
jgi:hypothetical protein